MKRSSFLFILFTLVSNLLASNIETLNSTLWRTTISGNTELMLTLKIRGADFSLTSREGSTKDIVGRKYLFARMFGKVRPTAVEVVGKCYYVNDSLILEGKYTSLSSKQDFKGVIYKQHLDAKLSNSTMSGAIISDNRPLANYSLIATEAIDKTEQLLYNPALLKSKEWKEFKKQVTTISGRVCDDYEFEKVFNFRVQKLPFTHYGLSLKKKAIQTGTATIRNSRTSEKAKFSITAVNDHTTLFTIRTFSASAEEIIPYIDTLKRLNPRNLIIDLRNNGGGTIASALPLAAYLVNETLYGGLFLTQKYFSAHNTLPSTAEYSNFQLFSEASFSLIIEGIHKYEGLCLMVKPDADNYKGNVYILTNKYTASTCEPFVYGLKQNNRATIVGEQTAGAMLNGEKFELSEKFNLFMPTADYYTADGKKIDKTGVTPNVVVKPEMALDKAIELIR